MGKFFDIKCRNCGSPVEYDIVSQSYRCTNCGELTGIEEAKTQTAAFRKLDSDDRKKIFSEREAVSCPNCGAELIYEKGEENEECLFCKSKLVRKEFENSGNFPEYIIPFFITDEEAKERLKNWAEKKQHRNTPEGRMIMENLDKTEGCYLPYELVKGPVSGYVYREHARKEYNIKGYVDSALVSTSRILDNETLDAIEPFELGQLKPFEHGYIGSKALRLADISGAKRERRTLKETANHLSSYISRIFGTSAVRINLTDSDLMEMPILLPVYILKVGRRLAVVNGQTGRVAVKTNKEKKPSKLWIFEAGLLSLVFFMILQMMYNNIIVTGLTGGFFTGVIFALYAKEKFSVFGKLTERGKASRAERIDKKIRFSEEKDKRQIPFSEKPVFYEKTEDGERIVKYKFYPPSRIAELTVRMGVIAFLPVIIAAVMRFVFHMGSGFDISMASAWILIGGLVFVAYFIFGVRREVYNRPYIYELCGNGKWKLTGTGSSRRLALLSVLGFTGTDKVTGEELGIPSGKLKAALVFVIFVAIGMAWAVIQ